MLQRCSTVWFFGVVLAGLPACAIDGSLVEKDGDPGFDSSPAVDSEDPGTETAETAEPLTAPEIDVSPGSVTFPVVAVGESATSAFSVTNLGDADLTVADVLFDGSAGPFTLTSTDTAPFARVLAPGAWFDVVVSYTPTTSAAASAVARVTSDDADEPSVPVEIGAPGCDAGPPWAGDLLVAPSYTDGELAVVVGDGAGGFSAVFSPTASVGEAVDGPVVADFDEDGGWDIVARGSTSGTLYSWRWDRCEAAWVVSAGPVLGFVPAGGADLDGDGHVDLFGGTPGWGDGRVALGDGAGGFVEAPSAFDVAPAYTGYGLTFAYHPLDLDGDGTLDLAAAAYDGAGEDSSELWWYPGRGDGTFDAPVRGPSVPTSVNGLDLGDVDGDGEADLVCGGDDDGDAGQAFLVLGAGAGLGGTAAPLMDFYPSTESGTNNPGAARGRLWDWNVDGSLDLAFALETDPYSTTSHEILYLAGDGSGAFSSGGVAMALGALRGYALAVPVPSAP